MPDTRLTDLTAITSLATDDWFYVVDKSDTTDNAAGSSKKIAVSDVMATIEYDLLSTLTASEVAVTGTVTATISKMHVISGTSADYTITLPAASTNTGKLIGFRVKDISAASKIYTLDGNASETIDGVTTRKLWAEESCVLLCDGSHWYKIAGKSRPMMALMYLSASSSGFAYNTWTKAAVDTIDFDNTGAIGDTTNKRLNCIRTSDYLVKAAVTFDRTGTTGGIPANNTRLIVRCRKNGAGGALAQKEESGITGAYSSPQAIARVSLTAGDYIEVEGYHLDTVNNLVFYGAASSPDNTALSIIEIPTW